MEDIGAGPVALDTSVFLYFIEDHAVYAPFVAPIFEAMAGGRLQAVTSAVSLLEVLVVPYRNGHLAVAERYEALLHRSRGLRLCELDLPILRGAAQLRALLPGLRTPDALQVSTALLHRCRALVTNDARLSTVSGLTVCQLNSYLP